MEEAKTVLKDFLYEIFLNEDLYNVTSLSEMLEMVTSMTDMMTMLLVGIAAISLLVAGIGIMNIMLVSVTEHVRSVSVNLSVQSGVPSYSNSSLKQVSPVRWAVLSELQLAAY